MAPAARMCLSWKQMNERHNFNTTRWEYEIGKGRGQVWGTKRSADMKSQNCRLAKLTEGR